MITAETREEIKRHHCYQDAIVELCDEYGKAQAKLKAVERLYREVDESDSAVKLLLARQLGKILEIES